jgi:hypothetical protein
MTAMQYMLADDDSSGWLKAVPALIIVAIWILGMVSAIIKRSVKSSAAFRAPTARPAAHTKPIAPKAFVTSASPTNRPAIAKVSRPIARPGALNVARTNAVIAQQQANAIKAMLANPAIPGKKRREPALPKRQPAQSVLSEVRPAPRDPPPVPQAKELPRVDSRGLAKRMQPNLLRYQYILTEVLRPPVALRGEEDDY